MGSSGALFSKLGQSGLLSASWLNMCGLAHRLPVALHADTYDLMTDRSHIINSPNIIQPLAMTSPVYLIQDVEDSHRCST